MRVSFVIGCSAAALTVAACSGTTITQNNVVISGGSTSSGGVGGASAIGGATQTGGMATAGGTTAFGGSLSTGGTSHAGGSTSAGGTLGNGGATSIGGAPATGGTTFTGGTSASGGIMSTGGANATGGTSAYGGVTSTGGILNTGGTNIATGGISATGGASALCQTGLTKCGGDCVDVTSDFNNCSVCDIKCGTGKICVSSACVAAPPSHPLWVTNKTQVQVVDTAAGGGIVATITVGGIASELVITPNRQKVYVANSGSNIVSVINIASRTLTTSIPVGTSPGHIAVTPDGSRIYASNGGSNTVSVIDSTTDTVLTSIPLSAGVGGIAVKPDGKQLWVSAGYGPDILNVLSIPDHAVLHSAGAGSGFIGDVLRFLPNSSILYAASGCGCCGNVRLFNASTFAAITSNPWGNPGAGLAISPDGAWVYGGATGSGCNGVGTLVKMDSQTGSIRTQVAMPVTNGMAVSPDGTLLYVTLTSAPTLAVVDANSLTSVRTFDLGGAPIIGEVQ